MSEIFVDTIKNKAGSTSLDSDKLPDMYNGSIRAWVNFDGTGTIAARDSHNLSSLTDGGTGKYDINMTNAMDYSDGSYGMNMDCNNRDVNDDGNCKVWGIRKGTGTSITGSKLPVQSGEFFNNASPAFTDSNFITVSIYGDLA